MNISHQHLLLELFFLKAHVYPIVVELEFVNEFQNNPVQVYQSSPDPIKSLIRDMAQSCPIQSPCGDPAEQLGPMLSNPLKS